MVASGGSLEQFETLVGPVDRVQAGWYAHLVAQRAALAATAPVGGGRQGASGPLPD